MESSGLPGRIQVTAATYERLCNRYTFEERGEIEVKGKGRLKADSQANLWRRRRIRREFRATTRT